MKKKKPEFDVDFIQTKPLTAEVEKQLSEYIKKLKAKQQKPPSERPA